MNAALAFVRARAIAITAIVALVLSGGVGVRSCCTPSGDTVARGLVISTPPTVAGLPVFNVQVYGAVGNGVADDRAAITAAMTAACASSAPATLFFPAGTYKVSRNASNVYALLLGCSRLTLQGVRNQSIIQLAAGQPAATVNILYVDTKDRVSIRDLVFDGNWGNAVTAISAASNGATLPQATINVDDASDFPAGTFPVTIILANSNVTYVTCTGHTSTTLTGCSGGSGKLWQRNVVGYADAAAGLNHTTNSAAKSTIAVASNGATLPQGTINIADSTSFDSGGANISIQTSRGYEHIACTGKAAGQLTGCTGGGGTLSTGGEIFESGSTEGRLGGITLASSTNVDIQNVVIKRTYGDCLYMSGSEAPTDGVRVIGSDCTMSARNAITFGTHVRNVLIDGFRGKYMLAQAIDSEPVFWPVYGITVTNSYLGGWWNNETVRSAPMSIAGGNGPSNFSQSASARFWRVTNNYFEGGILMSNAWDVVISNNRFIVDNATNAYAPITIGTSTADITVANNYVYVRAPTATASPFGADCCGILVAGGAGGSGARNDVRNVKIYGNDVHVRNGRFGISVNSAGGSQTAIFTSITAGSNGATLPQATINVASTTGFPTSGTVTIYTSLGPQDVTYTGKTGTTLTGGAGGTGTLATGYNVRTVAVSATGTASSITDTTLVDSGATWATNQWAGSYVRVGAVMADITSNNGTTLTLAKTTNASSTAWSTTLGDHVANPSAGAYVIHRHTGLVDVFDNTVEATNDGWGAGSNCINVSANGSSNQMDSRVRVHHNQLRNCGTDAIKVNWNVSAFAPFLEITDNFAHDDQRTPTTTNMIEFTNATSTRAIKLLLRGNVTGEGVTTAISGLSVGVWLVSDGMAQEWEGFGSPESVVTARIGATYHRRDGGAATSIYVKESGTGNTGWVAK